MASMVLGHLIVAEQDTFKSPPTREESQVASPAAAVLIYELVDRFCLNYGLDCQDEAVAPLTAFLLHRKVPVPIRSKNDEAEGIVRKERLNYSHILRTFLDCCNREDDVAVLFPNLADHIEEAGIA